MSTTNGQLAQGALLVGSVPLNSADAVFRAASAALGAQLRRLPDGETGERTYWMVFQLPLLAKNPAFRAPLGRIVGPFLRAYARRPLVRRLANRIMAGSQAGGLVLARIKPGVRVEDIRLGPLGYAAAAATSYARFKQLKAEGVIPPHMRFQVALPTPLAPLDFFSARDQARLAPVFEARMLDEIHEIAALVPPRELAIQWDTAVEFAMLEGVWPTPFGSPAQSRQPIVDMLVRIGNAVPGEVELGYHLCYGDAANKHFKEPRDSGLLADIARGVTEGVARRIDWIHFPVPRGRTDIGYLEPMRSAGIRAETELYVGLVHQADALRQARARIATAQHVLERPFGIATECGLGRRLPQTIPDLLRRHAELAAPIMTP